MAYRYENNLSITPAMTDAAHLEAEQDPTLKTFYKCEWMFLGPEAGGLANTDYLGGPDPDGNDLPVVEGLKDFVAWAKAHGYAVEGEIEVHGEYNPGGRWDIVVKDGAVYTRAVEVIEMPGELIPA